MAPTLDHDTSADERRGFNLMKTRGQFPLRREEATVGGSALSVP